MTQRHLSDVSALEVAFGEAQDPGAAAHVAECAECGTRVALVREGRNLAAEATLPEPGDVFWRALRARVASRVEAQAAAARAWRVRLRAAWSLAAVTAIVAFAVVWPTQRTHTTPAAAVPAAWVPLESPDEDAGLALVGEVVPAVEEEGQSWAECSGCLEGLTDQERKVVIDTLRQEIGRKS
jgi:hypothetical protein